MLLKEFTQDTLQVKVYDSRAAMGKASAEYAIEVMKKLLQEKEEINVIFSAAPSQNEMLEGLVNATEIDYTRVNAYHMDEYMGLDATAPQRFGNFLDRHIFKRLPFKNIYYIDGGKSVEESCDRYTKLLQSVEVDISLLGIGENGHIAFNDPHVADFNDPKLIKVVELDTACRQQQVNDGCFATLADVPECAVTLTIPALMCAKYVICTVPTEKKCNAVTNAVQGAISESCPASILRQHNTAVLFVDSDSGKHLLA